MKCDLTTFHRGKVELCNNMNIYSIWNAHHSVWFGFGFRYITMDVEKEKKVNGIICVFTIMFLDVFYFVGRVPY